MSAGGVHDRLVQSLWRQLDNLGYGTSPEVHMRGYGQADLLVSRGKFRHLTGHADAAIEVKSALNGRLAAEKACRQVLRYAVGWRRDCGRIAVPIIVPANQRVGTEAIEVCRSRAVNLVLGAEGQRLQALVALIGPPHVPESSDYEGWLRHGPKHSDFWGMTPQQLADRKAAA